MSWLRRSLALPQWRLLIVVTVLGVTCLGSLGQPAIAADDLAQSVPGGAVAFVEVSNLGSWIEKLQHSPLVADLQSNPQVQAFYQSSQGQKVDAGRKIVETQLGMDVWTIAKTVLGGRIGAAFYLREGHKQPDALIVIQVNDTEKLNLIRERLAPWQVLTADQTTNSAGPGGVTVKAYDNKIFSAEKDNWIALASTKDLLTKSLSLRAGESNDATKPLSQDTPYVAMTKQMGDRHLARLFFNIDMVAKAQGGRLGPDKLDNPLLSLLLGGIYELANRSPFAGLSLDINDQQFQLTAGVAGSPESLGETYKPFFADAAEGHGASLPKMPQLIGGITLHRDYAGWYKRREALLQAKVLPEFDKFEGGLANLLPSRDVGEDILPTFGRNLTFVAAPQSFSHLNGKPGLQLPGFGLIVDLAKPDEGAELLQLFFQTVSSIVNLDAGQQGRQPWVLASETYKDVQINFGKYGQKPKGDRLPIVFNFMPAGARVGDKFVMCSSVDLCKQLIDVLSSKPAPVTATRSPTKNDFHFELTGATLADALDVNRELLQARSVQEGKSSEQAKTEVGTFLQIIRSIRTLRLTTGTSGEGYRVQLEALWK